MIRVSVLGVLHVTDQHTIVPVPRAAHHLIAVLAAAGEAGISREELAQELWGTTLPDSWMSALRNRTTAARKVLGATALLSSNSRYRFGPQVRVDSWDLIEHNVAALGPANELDFLVGEPFIDVPASALTTAHAARVREARVTLIDQAITTSDALAAPALQALRIYQLEHQLDPAIAIATVRAHTKSGQREHAVSIVAKINTATTDLAEKPAWVYEAEQALAPPTSTTPEDAASRMRARLFNEAASTQNWTQALEVALQGGPEAERMDGDPERIALLERIPTDALENSVRFKLALAFARHLVYAGREAEARTWANRTIQLATTPNDKLLSDVTRAIVGDVTDHRAAIVIPADFHEMPVESLNSRSMQVVVMSHHERSSAGDAINAQQWYARLVEHHAEPQRRWHLLLLQSMNRFVAGMLTEAIDAARAAFDYGSLFEIADAEITFAGQLSNARLIDPSLPGVDDITREFPSSESSTLCRGLQAISQARRTGDDAVDQFLRTYDYRNGMYFTFGLVSALAPYVRSSAVRAEIETQLRQRTGTSVIWGTGVLHLGPVDRILARIVADPSEIPELLTNAIAVADRQHACIWQVICRLDLAAATTDLAVRREAEAMAITPELRDLVTTYEPWPAAATI